MIDTTTIIVTAALAIPGFIGTWIHGNHSRVKEECISNYSQCILNEKPDCDKIKEVCHGYLKEK